MNILSPDFSQISPLGSFTLVGSHTGGYTNPDADPYTDAEEQRVISGVALSQLPADVAGNQDVQEVIDYSEGNGLEHAVATELGEPIRTTHWGSVVEPINDPTWGYTKDY